jgi:uncharacterized protein YndB with AHSA1/START domain
MPRPDASGKKYSARFLSAGPDPRRPWANPATENIMAHELVLDRLLDAPAEKLFRLWTDPTRMHEWFCPKPWTVTDVELDLRPGGACNFTMHGPNGEVVPNSGQYLEIVPNRKIVFTDAFTGDWKPKDGAPFMVATVTFEPQGGKTRYVCVARHWTEAEMKKHEQMGFHEGWGIVADQLEALAKTI